ncbi:TPA: hypothetical protein ACXG88_005480, partial [Klebsiella pneumoniae]
GRGADKKKGPQMRAYGCVVVSAQLSLKANRQIFIAALWAGINRYVLSPQRKERLVHLSQAP